MRGPANLGPYRIGDPLGRGGMGEVFAATHEPTGTPVAVKVLSRGHAAHVDARRLFRDEVRATAALCHPHVIAVHDHGEVDADAAAALGWPIGSPWLAMEQADDTLRRHAGRIGWRSLRSALLAILDALAHAHARGLVHRDIKASNVLLARGRPKLADFGIAWIAEHGPRVDVSGTPAYMAPEQITGDWRMFGPPTDLYSLGCLAFLLATGHAPFRGQDPQKVATQHLERSLPPLGPARVGQGFEAWLHRLTQRSPAARYAFAAEAAEALAALPHPDDDDDDRPDEVSVVELDCETVTLVLDGAAEQPAWQALPVAVSARAVPADWRSRDADRSARTLVGAGLGLFGVREQPVSGREAERDRLWQALARVAEERTPRAVTLRGPAGVGKSRLARWLCERGHELGAAEHLHVTHAERPEPGDGVAAALRRHLRCADGDPHDLAHAVGVLELPEADRRLLARSLAPVPDPGIQPGERRFVLRRALGALARRRPLVLWLDDLQWGASSLALVGELLSGDDAVLAVITLQEEALALRPVEAALLPSGTRVEELTVGALDRVAHEELVARLLGLDPAAVAAVTARTLGNPMFAVELVGDWVERGLLEVGPQGLRAPDGKLPELPADLATVWDDRVRGAVRRLPPGALQSVEAAAVLGMRLDPAEWTELCVTAGLPADPAVLDTLLDQRLLLPEAGGRGLLFAHGMLREAVLASAARAGRRRRLDGAAASVLAGRTDAIGLARYGTHALDAGAPGDAAAALERALEQGGRLGPGLVRSTLDALGKALDALEATPDDPRRVRHVVQRARFERMHGDAERGLALLDEALSRPPVPGAEAAFLDGERLRGELLMIRGRATEALPGIERALGRARALGVASEVLPTLVTYGNVLLACGRRSDARGCFVEARALPDVPPVRVAQLELALGECALAEGELDAADQHFRTSREGFRAQEYAWGQGHAVGMLADVARVRGDTASSRALYLEAREILERSGSPTTVFVDMSLAIVDLAEGRAAEADALLARAEGVLGRRRQTGHRALCWSVRARAAADLGAWDLLDAALAEVDALPSWAHPEGASALAKAAEVSASSGQSARALRAWASAARLYERLGNEARAAVVRQRIAELAAREP